MNRSDEILFEIADDALFVANGGRHFDRKGVISVCASHLSDKRSGGVTDHFGVDDNHLISAIRDNELSHYNDPNRIVSDFNAEDEIRRDYGGRFIWELLQNADDAMGEPGRSSAELIGSKGLGFKAVLELTDEPEIHSGPFHFLFSVERTQRLLRAKKLHNDPPRLTFRIPHSCEPDHKVRELMEAGYATVVRLPFRDEQARQTAIHRVREIGASFLLLAQEIPRIRIRFAGGELVHAIERQQPGLADGVVELSNRNKNGSCSTSWRRWFSREPAPSAYGKRLTAAICLPLNDQRDAVPHGERIPLYVFFPTEEQHGAHALIHASFDLQANRKHIRSGQHDDAIITMFGELFERVILDIPARTALEAFGQMEPEGEDSLLDKVKTIIRDTLTSTAFVPVIGGELVRPSEVRIWKDLLGSILRHDAREVRDAKLLVSELNDLTEILGSLGAEPVDDQDYIRLLQFCRNDTSLACFRSWRALVTGGLRRVRPTWDKQGYERDLEDLRAVPCWWSEDGNPRALDREPRMLFARPDSWPDWLPADALHPRIRKVVERWEARADERHKARGSSDYDTRDKWKNLISGRLSRTEREFLHDVLLPFVRGWDTAEWETEGWKLLGHALQWSRPGEFEAIPPWVAGPESNKEEQRRAQAANILRFPADDRGWLPATDCYAGHAWEGPTGFDRHFASVENRGLVRRFGRWPTRVRKGTTKEQWKTLLRWAGVSWEPKVRRVNGSPQHDLVGVYRERSNAIPYTSWTRDWEIEGFPECIHSDGDRNRRDEVIRMMLPLVDSVKRHKAAYFYRTNRAPEIYANFADYQLRHAEWLPCKPSLFHAGRKVAPTEAFLPETGLGALFPEVDKGKIGDEEWYSRILPKLRDLGVRDKLPEDPEEWHQWMRELPERARTCGDEVNKADSRTDKGGQLRTAANALYRRYLQLDGDGVKLPEGINIPCEVWVDDRETVVFAPPSGVYYVDEPHFDEVRREIIRAGYKLFILRLNAGRRAPEVLGVCSLSGVLQATPHYETEVDAESSRLLKRYLERRKAITYAAKLSRPLPEDLNIMAVGALRLQLTAKKRTVANVDVMSWREKDGALLINLDKDEWRALANGLAARIVGTVDKEPLFENLLRARDREEVLDRIRSLGVTEEDIEEVRIDWDHDQREDDDQDRQGGQDDDGDRARGRDGDGEGEGERDQDANRNQQRDGNGDREQDRHQDQGPRGNHERDRDRAYDRESDAGQRRESNGTQRPHPESGIPAEDWLYERLEEAFPGCVRRRVRDHMGRESDFVLSLGRGNVHIEVKHSVNRPGTLYWSDLECSKANELKQQGESYYMVMLFPSEEQSYEIDWIWNPLDELMNASRDIQWAGESEYSPVATLSWKVDSLRPSHVPTNHYRFRIRLDSAIEERLLSDTIDLEVLRNKIKEVQDG